MEPSNREEQEGMEQSHRDERKEMQRDFQFLLELIMPHNLPHLEARSSESKSNAVAAGTANNRLEVQYNKWEWRSRKWLQ